MASIRAKIIRAVSRAYMQRVEIDDLHIETVRRTWNRIGRWMLPAFRVKIEKSEMNGLYAEWFTPKHAASDSVLLYLHGGAYVVGGCDMHRQLVSHIARAGRIRTILPEYRLAPEHKFPAAIEDAVGFYRTLVEQGFAPENIVLAGDSAGGGLTVATLLALRDAGDPLPAAAVLLSPFLDVTGSGESTRTRANLDPWFRSADIVRVADFYCAPAERCLPLVSPVFANPEGLPPFFIQVGDHEILLSDSERFAKECSTAGVAVDLEIWPEMFHVFQMFTKKMPESKRAIDGIGKYIQSIWREVPR